MADAQASIAPLPELESPAIEQPELETADKPEAIPSPADEAATDADAEGNEGEQQPDDGLEEFDFGFKKYRLDPALNADIEKWRSSTTQKEQATSERAKALEQREAALKQQAEATDAELDARSELRAINGKLAEYAKLKPEDWFAHQQNDPYAVQQAQLQLTLLNNRKAELEGHVGRFATERTQKAQQEFAKRVEETLAEAPKIIPGWNAATSESTIKELVAYAQSEGIPDQVLQDMWSPKFLKLLHRASIGEKALSKPAVAKPAPTPVTPLRTVTGKSTPGASRTLGDLASSGNMEEYAKARAAGRIR